MVDKLRILSQNVRGVRDNKKRRKVFYWLRRNSAQIIFIQESHSTEKDEKQWHAEWGNDIFFAHGKTDSCGVAILFKGSVTKEIHNVIRDTNGRFIILDITLDDTRCTLCNIYGPNNDNPQFFLNVIENIESFDNEVKILGGDFNTVLNASIDKSNLIENSHPKTSDFLNNILEEMDLVDIWRHCNPLSKLYTWSRHKPSPIFSRIDYFLVSFSVCNKITDTTIKPGFLSDHSAIVIELQLKCQERGPGFWKLNCNLLKDIEYVNMIKQTISDAALDNKGADDMLLWDTIKLKIRGDSIAYSARKKRNLVNNIALLERKIKQLEKNYYVTQSDETLQNIENVKNELNDEIEKKTNGAKIRCRVRWYEDGEKGSKYFLNLEKRNFNNKVISRLQMANGNIIENPKEILKEQKLFYERLYKGKGDIVEDDDYEYFFSQKGPKLSPEASASCEGPILESEILSALKSTKNNKSPGSDGLPSEFYKIFWQDVKEYLCSAIKSAFQEGNLSFTQRQGNITLLPKKDKNTLFLKNWRPITLLNVDYKLIAKLIATRMKKQLHNIINSDQSGFISDRYIGENINRILNIIEMADDDFPAILMLIDFEKAYDFLEWPFIDKALKYFNFGDNVRKWVTVMYTGTNSCVVNNGWRSDFFNISRGVRQGCPLSPYLFIIAAEILALAIRNNPKIEGIKVGKEEVKLSQYADDTSISLKFSADSLEETIRVFRRFEIVSGLKMNLEKTEILRLGTAKDNNDILCPHIKLKWTNGPVRVLGVLISNNLNLLEELNYAPILPKLRSTISMWSQRDLSLYGKSTIIKSLLFPKLTYLMSVLPNPSVKYLTEINSIMFKFLWRNGPHRIAKNVMYSDKTEGGLRVTNIEIQCMALKIAWVKRLLNGDETDLWKICVNDYIPKEIWYGNLRENDIKHVKYIANHRFWCDVMTAWSKYSYVENVNDIDTILSQTLWFNSHIRINNKPVFLNKWSEKGVKKVKQLLDHNGKWLSKIQFEALYMIQITDMLYNSIISSIPRYWKNIIRDHFTHSNEIVQSKVDTLVDMPKVCKETYGEMIKIIEKTPINTFEKWSNEMQSEVDLHTCFRNLDQATISTKIKNFHFKFLHRIIPTNIKLFKWKILDTELCSFCKRERESLFHLFWTCTYVQMFIYRLEQWYKRYIGKVIKLDKTTFFFGKSGDSLYNLLCIIARWCIYIAKVNNFKPCINLFHSKVKDINIIEKYIAVKNDRIETYNNKWSLYKFN